jgi:mRNA-degrading endonuclease RelE of RelBE toxin-antitoxin system
MDPLHRDRVLDALERLAANQPDVDVERVTGSDPPEHRVRVGGWRAIVHLDDDAGVITVLRVARRSQVYRRGG